MASDYCYLDHTRSSDVRLQFLFCLLSILCSCKKCTHGTIREEQECNHFSFSTDFFSRLCVTWVPKNKESQSVRWENERDEEKVRWRWMSQERKGWIMFWRRDGVLLLPLLSHVFFLSLSFFKWVREKEGNKKNQWKKEKQKMKGRKEWRGFFPKVTGWNHNLSITLDEGIRIHTLASSSSSSSSHGNTWRRGLRLLVKIFYHPFRKSFPFLPWTCFLFFHWIPDVEAMGKK